MPINISASYDNFRELRENNSFYVDKTDIIEEYLVNKFDKAILFARPRRFGKTLTMTMFRDFLDIRQESKGIFKGLKVMEHPRIVEEYMNKYPVVFLSLKEVFGSTFQEIYKSYRLQIANCCKEIEDILDDNNLSEADKDIFRKLVSQDADETNTIAALDLLARMLQKHYKMPVFLKNDRRFFTLRSFLPPKLNNAAPISY